MGGSHQQGEKAAGYFRCFSPSAVANATAIARTPPQHGFNAVAGNIALSGFFFYIYNEFAFAFTSQVGAVTSSVLNTAKRVIIIVASAIIFQEGMGRNKMVGSAIAITGTFLYSLASKMKKKPAAKKD